MPSTIETPYRTPKEAKAKARVGQTKLYELLNAGVLRAKKSGRRTLISDESIDAYLASLPDYEPRKSRLNRQLPTRKGREPKRFDALGSRYSQLETLTYNQRRPRRNSPVHHHVADDHAVMLTDTMANQLSVGGRLVHRRTHRCVAFCNAVAALADIGPVEAR